MGLSGHPGKVAINVNENTTALGQVGFTLTPEDNTSSPHWDLACDTQESFTQLLTLIDRQGKWTHK